MGKKLEPEISKAAVLDCHPAPELKNPRARRSTLPPEVAWYQDTKIVPENTRSIESVNVESAMAGWV